MADADEEQEEGEGREGSAALESGGQRTGTLDRRP
jgi:hypothetical protein